MVDRLRECVRRRRRGRFQEFDGRFLVGSRFRRIRKSFCRRRSNGVGGRGK